MNDILKKAIERELIKKPSASFTDEVMDAIFAQNTVPAYQPLISAKGWVVIGVVMISVIAMVLSVMPNSANNSFQLVFLDNIESYFKSIHFKIPDLFSGVNLIVVSGVSLAIFLLLFFDTLFLRRKRF